MMLTRSRARASNQPVFVDDKWNDAYIQTKDEQIDALLAADSSQLGWDQLGEEGSEPSEADSGSDVWLSDAEDSDEEDEEDEEDEDDEDGQRPRSAASRWLWGGSLAQNVCWTAATAAVAPMLLYCALPRSADQAWPLRSVRLAGTLAKVALNLLTLGAAALALYGAACSSESLWTTDALLWRRLQLETPRECSAKVLADGRAFLAVASAALPWEASPDAPERGLNDAMWAIAATLAPVARQWAGLALGATLALTCFHRGWMKTLVLLTAASYAAFNAATELQLRRRAAVEIFSLDPSFAFANESIFVRIAVDGQNLEQGGSVAWVAYWGCLQQQQARVCPKRFPQQLANGGVLATFGQVDEYVPCYLSARASASAVVVDGELRPSEGFRCFEDIRLRVKDQKSVPGWSLRQPPRQDEPASTPKQEL
ncbi:hypothetical protein BBJ28_00007901 [Nothophytophthora sp. Chile5]|nr:hypothetical protein BBJ28_00007901 [Nothophytophthora sp. Chile5]